MVEGIPGTMERSMKKSVLMRLLLAGAIACVSVVGLAGSSYETSKVAQTEEPGGVGGWWCPPTYRCKECGAPNGGCYFPLCPDCHNKQQDKDKPVPIDPFKPRR